VKLEFDVRKRDKYGRLLAYVYVDDAMVNAQLLKKGLARAVSYPPNLLYQDRFNSLEQEAKEKGIGIWDENRGQP